MIDKYIIPACSVLGLKVEDLSDNSESIFRASGSLNLMDNKEFLLTIQVDSASPDMTTFDLKDVANRVGTRGGLPKDQFDVIKLATNQDPVTIMISRCYTMLLSSKSEFNESYIYKY